MQRFDLPFAEGALSVCRWCDMPDAVSDRPILHWAHANGFNAQTYDPLLAPLEDKFDIYACDARGHGHSTLSADPQAMSSWYIYRDDLETLVAHLAAQGGQKIWLGGHSMGGCTSVLLAAKRPDLVAGLVLVDPVITPYINWLNRLLMRASKGPGVALAQMAKKRKADWPDAATVEKAYAGRGAFATWEDGFLAAYLAGGLLPKGDGVTLACAPTWEAANFKGPQLDCRPEIANLRVPFTLLMAQEGSTTYFRKPFEALDVDKKIEIVAGSTHFLPMERAALVRAEICARGGV